MTSRLAAFALVVLSTLILAQQVCAADVIRHRQGTSNDYENCFIANTPFYQLAIDSNTGNVVNLHYRGWSRNVLGSTLPVLVWDSVVESGISEFPKLPASQTIEIDEPDKVVVCFSAKGDSPSTRNLTLQKRYELRTDTPVIHVRITAANSGSLQRLQYRTYNGLQVSDHPENQYTLYPRPNGVVRYDGKQHPYPGTRDIAAVKDFTAPWIATLNANNQGVIFLTDPSQTLLLRNIQFYPSIEVTYHDTAIKTNEAYETEFHIIPTQQLKHIDFVSPQLLLDVQHDDPIRINVWGLTQSKKVSMRVDCVTQDGRVAKELGKQVLDIDTNQPASLIFGSTDLKPGAYGLRGTVEDAAGKRIGTFDVPHTVGKTQQTYAVQSLSQSQMSAPKAQAITTKLYEQSRKSRKTDNALVVRRWSENTSYHVAEALSQRPNTHVKIATFLRSGLNSSSRDFPLDPEEFLNLDAIYLVDVPTHTFSKLDLMNLKDFVNAGGLLVVFTGSASGNSYGGSELEDLLPVTHDDANPKLSFSQSIFSLNPMPTYPVVPGSKSNPLLKGMDTKLPQSTVYPAKIKPGSEVLLSVRQTDQPKAQQLQPILISRKMGNGHVYSFAIRPDRRDLIDPLTTWHDYPTLIRRLMEDNMGQSLSPFTEPAKEKPLPLAYLKPVILEHDFNFRTDAKVKRQALNEWAMGRGDVFTWGSTVPLPVTIIAQKPMTLRFEMTITDPRGKTIHSFKSRQFKVNDQHTLNDQWQAPALARGAYQVTGTLHNGSTQLDTFTETLYCEPESDWRDYYPINFSYFGYGGRDVTTIQRGVEEVKILKDMGFNTIGYGYFTDEILKAGLYISTANVVKNLAWSHQSDFWDEINVDRFKSMLHRNYSVYHRRPRLGLMQTDDETTLFPNDGLGKIDKALFREKYGYEMPTDHKDPNWYFAANFRAQGMANAMRQGRQLIDQYAPVAGMTRDRAICFPTVHHHLPHPTWQAFRDGPGAPRYALAERWAASEPSHIDHTLAWTWAATDYSDTRLGLILGIIPQAGQEWKSALGFWLGICHGTQFLEGYTWVSTHGYLVDSQERVEVLSKTLNQIKEIAPLFLHLNKQRSGIAMLCPWKTSMTLDSTNHRMHWPEDYVVLRETFGQVDVVFDEQLETSLPNLDMLVIPRASISVHSQTQQRLADWSQSGGLLIGAPDVASKNEKRQVSTILADSAIMPRLDLRLPNADQKVRYLADGHVKLIAKSQNPKIVCNLHMADPQLPDRVLTAVNLDRAEQSTTLTLVLTDAKYQAIDMITGKTITSKQNGNVLTIPMTIDGAWGRVILLSPTPPTNVKLNAVATTDQLTYTVEVLDKNAKHLAMPMVCNITVTDPQGNDHFEYGGRLVTKAGKLTRTLPLPINEQQGTWTVTVTEGTSQSQAQTTFQIK